MSSDTIAYAYKQQVCADPSMAPHFLDCLKQIAGLRRSRGKDDRRLAKAVDEAYAAGNFASVDVDRAYTFFGLDPEDYNVDDNLILQCFYAYINSPTQEELARRQLWRIGKDRASDRLIAASEERSLSPPSRSWLQTPKLTSKQALPPLNKRTFTWGLSMIPRMISSRPCTRPRFVSTLSLQP